MTTITIDRVVLERVLDFLDAEFGWSPREAPRIDALREALAQYTEPLEPVAWECKAGGLRPLTQRQYDAQTAATKRHYTRIAPPQQEAVAWMYKAEPWFDGDSWHETYETTMDKTLAYFKDKNARALCFVEK